MQAFSKIKPEDKKYRQLFKWFRQLLDNNVVPSQQNENFIADIWDSLSKEQCEIKTVNRGDALLKKVYKWRSTNQLLGQINQGIDKAYGVDPSVIKRRQDVGRRMASFKAAKKGFLVETGDYDRDRQIQRQREESSMTKEKLDQMTLKKFLD